MKKIATFFMMALAAFLLTNCSKEKESPAQIGKESPSIPLLNKDFDGELLADITCEDGSMVKFYQFEDGELAVRVSSPLAADQEEAPEVLSVIDKVTQSEGGVYEIYKALSPVPDPKVEQKLRKVDESFREIMKYAIEEPIPGNDLISSNVDFSNTSAKCQPDYYNDRYGSDWFIRNFVNEGLRRYYMVNVGAGSYQFRDGNWTKTCAMAADFAVPIQFFGRQFRNLRWYYRWDMEIPPRYIETIYVTGFNSTLWSSHAVGKNPCFKVHIGICTNAQFVHPARNYRY